jgi:hypothetical protein
MSHHAGPPTSVSITKSLDVASSAVEVEESVVDADVSLLVVDAVLVPHVEPDVVSLPSPESPPCGSGTRWHATANKQNTAHVAGESVPGLPTLTILPPRSQTTEPL